MMVEEQSVILYVNVSRKVTAFQSYKGGEAYFLLVLVMFERFVNDRGDRKELEAGDLGWWWKKGGRKKGGWKR